jgi:hypothetical protein
MYADLSVGYWARHTKDRCQALTGLAYVCELHLNQSLEDQNVFSDGGFQVGSDVPNVTLLDFTVGAHVELYSLTTLTFAYCTPLSSDKQFDGQFRVMFNRRF